MVEANVRFRFSANEWCRVTEGQIMGQFIMEGRLVRALTLSWRGRGRQEAEISPVRHVGLCDWQHGMECAPVLPA